MRESETGYQEEVLHQMVVSMEQVLQGSDCGLKLTEFKKHLDNTLSLNIGWSCVQPGIGLDNPSGSLPNQNII